MNETLVGALSQKADFLKIQTRLIKKSEVLYRIGFFPDSISASQMGGITQCIRTAKSHQGAVKETQNFINKQITKLKNKGETVSWNSPPCGAGGESTLGETLLVWIENQKYMKSDDLPNDDQFALLCLRRFWNNVYDRYLYARCFNKNMTIFQEVES